MFTRQRLSKCVKILILVRTPKQNKKTPKQKTKMVLTPLLVSAGPFLMGKHVVSAERKTQIFSDLETQLPGIFSREISPTSLSISTNLTRDKTSTAQSRKNM